MRQSWGDFDRSGSNGWICGIQRQRVVEERRDNKDVWLTGT